MIILKNRLKKLMKLTSVRIIIVTVLIAAVGLGWLYYSRPNIQLVFSLRYENASEGLAPDGTRFSVYEILPDEVLDKVAEKTGNQVDSKTLADNIVINAGTYSDYATTTYSFAYNDGAFFGGSEEKVLRALGEAYKDHFLKEYQNNETALEILGTSETEYIILRDHYSTEADRLYRYLEQRELSNKMYMDDNGVSFSDLKKEAEELIRTDLRNLSAYIVENSAVLDKSRTVGYLEYKNNSLTKDYTELMNAYDAYKKVLEMYDSEMSAIVMIPTINGDLEYYMSRTKTGIDYLTEKAESALSSAQAIKRVIQENKQYLSNLGKGGNDKKVDALIDSIEQDLTDLSEKATQFDRAYSARKTAGLISYKINKPPTFWFLKQAAVIFGGWLVCVIVIIVIGRKEKRHA